MSGSRGTLGAMKSRPVFAKDLSRAIIGEQIEIPTGAGTGVIGAVTAVEHPSEYETAIHLLTADSNETMTMTLTGDQFILVDPVV